MAWLPTRWQQPQPLCCSDPFQKAQYKNLNAPKYVDPKEKNEGLKHPSFFSAPGTRESILPPKLVIRKIRVYNEHTITILNTYFKKTSLTRPTYRTKVGACENCSKLWELTEHVNFRNNKDPPVEPSHAAPSIAAQIQQSGGKCMNFSVRNEDIRWDGLTEASDDHDQLMKKAGSNETVPLPLSARYWSNSLQNESRQVRA